MSSVLLNTNTATLLELLGNGKRYKVPAFQRDYSWDEERWEDLWADIIALGADDSGRHYMGTVVVAAQDDRTMRIIDGQQRLATLSVFALAVIDRLESLAKAGTETEPNLERARSLRDRFIGDKDPASLILSSKLTLNETDDGFYQDYLVQLRRPQSVRSLPRSSRLLNGCFEWFKKRLHEDRTIGNSGEAIAALLSEVAARRLYFIVITVDDDLNAYTVFETLNARGMELSSTDLLKNYLFSKCGRGDLDWMRRQWAQIVGRVKQERFPEFVRYHLLCDQPSVRSARVFKLIRDSVKDSLGAIQFIHAIEPRAELFSALEDPTHEFWIDQPKCKESVRVLKLLGVRQMMPLLFAAWEKQKPNFEAILRDLVVLALRHTVIGGRNPNELERPYHEAARAVLDGRAVTPTQIFSHLVAIYPRDEAFERDFQFAEIATSGQRRRLAKYLLTGLEADASAKSIDFETDPGTIEHILPENPREEWEDNFPIAGQPALTYRIGNLTLLEANLNRDAGNETFDVKRDKYLQSRYTLTRKISEEGPSEWTPAAVEQRSAVLAKRACHVWRAGGAQ